MADNVWLTAEADLDLIFDGEHTSKWTRALAQLGVGRGLLSSQGGPGPEPTRPPPLQDLEAVVHAHAEHVRAELAVAAR